MSIVSCFFILLLCLSKQDSCKARLLGARYKGTIFSAEYFHYSSKGVSPVGEKVKLEMDSVQGGITIGGDSTDDHDHEHRVTTTTQEHATKESERRKFSGGVLRKQPLVYYVSWRVPFKKQDKYKNNHKDKHPGFFSDYSRPRTRPPSHN